MSAADAARLHVLEDLFSGLRVQTVSTDDTDRLDLDEIWGRDLPFSSLANAVVGTINLRALSAGAGKLLLHAGAVCRPTGGTLVLAGPSGSGKTTLTGRLVERGSGYVTDETVALSARDLLIEPYRKPLSIKVAAQDHFPTWRPNDLQEQATHEPWLVSPQTLGGPLPPPVLVPELIIFPTFRQAAPTTLSPVPAVEAAYLLGADSSRLRDIVPSPTAVLARLGRRAPAFRLIYSSTEEAADAVESAWYAVA